ncbi:Cytochrome P450 [Macrophomina phaseolina MS6]|uniref:Cytochrome P450 n=1 Tax=Macrophomina phaseolina (strain MS6) TaxID=1126212 RepID=K2RAM8_MACPH|nr:Cytochrome P450 [Macrophomina phaseolina MS6]
MAVAIASVLVSYIPLLLRPLAKPLLFLPTLWIRSSMKRMLRPIIEADMREYEQTADKKSLLGPKEKGKVQLTGWLMSRYKGQVTLEQLVKDYITVSFESTPSSAGTLFFVMAELAADPALAEELREEIKTVLDEDGHLPQSHLNGLQKMDSVMRESSRMNGFSHLVLYRKLLTPRKLSIGPELPAGTNICVDAHNINYSEKLWDNPAKFDGLRHYRTRQDSKNESRFKFANLGNDAPGWGDGLQACPGRLFADNTIKIALTHLLLHYDFKLRPGDEKPKKGSMPNGSMMPDLKAKVLFKSRNL